jgi:hypothetical protein
MGSRANIYIDQGTDFRLTVELFDDDEDTNTVIDTSVLSFYGNIRKMYSSRRAADFDIEKSDNDITIILSSDVTSQLAPGKYQYDVLMRKQTGELSKIVEGLVFVIPTITEV